MTELYAHAHDLLNASQAAFEAHSYVAAILDLNGIAAAATTVLM